MKVCCTMGLTFNGNEVQQFGLVVFVQGIQKKFVNKSPEFSFI